MRATSYLVSPVPSPRSSSPTYADILNHISLPYVLDQFEFLPWSIALLSVFLANPGNGNQDGSDFMGQRLTVQFARGSRQREATFGGNTERQAPRPRRTPHRMQIAGLPNDTSWQVCSSFCFRLISQEPWPKSSLPVLV